jgi:Ca2+-binding RTX toxin-like protein
MAFVHQSVLHTAARTLGEHGAHIQDELAGDAGPNTINGTAGDDAIDISQGGNDTVNGKGGDDEVDAFAALTAKDKLDGRTGEGDAVVLSGDYSAGLTLGTTTMKNFEYFVLRDNFTYDITMNDGNVAAGEVLQVYVNITGGSAKIDASAETDGAYYFQTSRISDVLTGSQNGDIFRMNGGTDTLDGQGGFDRASYSRATAAVTVDLGLTTAQNTGYGTATLKNIENLSGSRFDDVLTGNVSDNFFYLVGGNDVATMKGGNDVVEAGGVNATGQLATTAKADGGAGVDTISFLSGTLGVSGALAVTVDLSKTGFQDTGSGTYKLVNFENAQGTTANDTLTGDGNANTLYGADGDDMLSGGGGADSLYGDKILLGYDENTGLDSAVNTRNSDAAGVDTIKGGAGNDTIVGGGLGDQLDGGAGNDTFVYESVSDSSGASHDIIDNFDASQDKFDFTVTIAKVDTAVTKGTVSSDTFDANIASAIGSAKLGAHEAVLFTPNKGDEAGHTFLLVDINGKAGYQAGKDIVIELTHATHLADLTAGDFV